MVTRSQQIEIELARLRRQAIEEAAAGGTSYSAVAEAIGLTRGRVSQIRSTGPAIERIMFGIGPLTIGYPLRPDPTDGRPLVAAEDVTSRDQLVDICESYGFVVHTTGIDPRQDWRPEGQDLIAICGPASSPTIATVLEGDPAIQFGRDNDGWYLHDLQTGDRWRSPMDADPAEQADVAYLGRIPFDDQRDLFLIAGLHTMGSLGAVHYLRHHLAQLHGQVGTARFSMLVRSTFDDDKTVTGSEAACQPLPH
jgi:hypothetical protein